MEFLAWHYSRGVDYYLSSWSRSLNWTLHYFSLPLLLKTLFAPWKRLIVTDTTPGFNLQKKFEVFTFNMISRGIGATVRFTLFWAGIFILIVTYLAGAIGFVFWLAVPVFGLGVYSKWKRQPANLMKELMFNIKASQKPALETIFSSEPGRFLLDHTGVTLVELLENAKKELISFDNFNPANFSDVIELLVEKQTVWTEEFFNTQEIIDKDLILAAKMWDSTQTEKTQIGGDGMGKPGLALELTFGYTPTLNRYSLDLAAPLDFSHRLIGREPVVSRMVRILNSGSSVMLMGQPGVGKKTVVLEFALKAANGLLGKELSFKRVLEFDYNSFLSESIDLNQKKANLAQIFAEASYAGNIILMVRDIQRLTNVDVEGYDFTDIIETHLEKRQLKLIAVASNTDYERFIAPNLRLRKYLEKVEVTPPNNEEALAILVEAAKRWEYLTNFTITVPTLRYILEESDRYVTDVPFPEKALEVLDAVISYRQQKGGNLITKADAMAVLAEKTGISFAALTETEKSRLEDVENIIHERLIDQNAAVNMIAKTLRAKTVGVIKENRPLGSFLFLGPTGVGKTETAKVLANVYYGSQDAIIRFDMAEYTGVEGLDRLIGSVSRNQPGSLTTAIKNKPASLLLLDEIEKASSDIYNLFLTLLDEGYLTDAFDKKINCRHLFVIGTSNAAAEYIRQLVKGGASGEELQKQVVNYVLEKEIFSPEFLNRFDGVVVYEPLRREDLVKIADLMLGDLSENLKKKNIVLNVDPGAKIKLSEDGYDPALGARPMRRIVNLSIGDLLGQAILKGEVKSGDEITLTPGEAKEKFELMKSAKSS